jgi:predicted transposase/invertase (TIGR01784 family)
MFKAVFSMKEVVLDFLQNTLPAEVLALYQLDTMELETASYLGPDLAKTFSDVVWQVPGPNGKLHTAFLFEHKYAGDTHVSLQLLEYICAIMRKDISGGEKPRFVLPILVYQGKKNWRPKSIVEILGLKNSILERFVPNFDFIFEHLSKDLQKKLARYKLELTRYVILTLGAVNESDYEEQMLGKMVQAHEALQQNEQLFAQSLSYLFRTSRVDKAQFEQNFKELINQVDMKKTPYTLKEQYEAAGYVKGREEGIEQGIEQGIELGEEKGVEKGVEKGIFNSFEVIKQYKAGISLKEIAKNLQLKYQLVKNAITEAKKMGLI